jgi:hypothetical protein
MPNRATKKPQTQTHTRLSGTIVVVPMDREGNRGWTDSSLPGVKPGRLP